MRKISPDLTAQIKPLLVTIQVEVEVAQEHLHDAAERIKETAIEYGCVTKLVAVNVPSTLDLNG